MEVYQKKSCITHLRMSDNRCLSSFFSSLSIEHAACLVSGSPSFFFLCDVWPDPFFLFFPKNQLSSPAKEKTDLPTVAEL